MKKDEFRNHPAFPAIKGAQRDLIKDVGGIERAAKLLGKSVALVGNFNNLNMPDLMGTMDIVILEADLGRPVVSKAAAGVTGATVIDPQGASGGPECMQSAALGVVSGCSVFMGEWTVAAADGHYSLSELYELRPHLRSVERAAGDAGAVVDRMISQRLQEAN